MPPSDRPLVRRTAAFLGLAALVLAPSVAVARDAATPKAASVPAASASAPAAGASAPSAGGVARPLEPEEEAAPLPPGHPMMAPQGDDEEDEPSAPPPGNPAAPHAGMPNMFQPPPDTSDEDPTLPAGTLVVDVKDADNRPIPNVPLVLTTLHQSVAKGQSKDNRPIQADANGRVRIDGLEIGSAVSYWVKDVVGPATFASIPAQLNASRGVHAVVHAYAVTQSLETAVIVVQGVIYFEVKDDRVQVEEAMTFFNFGKTAWVPDNFIIKLPKEFTALTSQAQMSDQGIDAVDKVGAKIRGTFAPGRHDLDFRWQLPYDGEKDLALDVPLPPHIAIMRVMAAAGHDTKLEVDGFPEAQKRTDRQGQKVLITEKQVSRTEPLTHVKVAIRGLLTQGPGRYYASGLALMAILTGIFMGVGPRTRSKTGAKPARAAILKELLELERAHRKGDVGPKTYERARRELVDAIAETLEVVA